METNLLTPYLVTRLCSDASFFKPGTYSVGDVEFRTGKNETNTEKSILLVSLNAFDESPRIIEVAPRASVIIMDEHLETALNKADIKFQETLDLMDACDSFHHNYFLFHAGYVRNLNNGHVEPLLPQKSLHQSPVFFINDEMYKGIDAAQYITLSEAESSNELIARLRRAAYWNRKSRNETDQQLKILFAWFAIEAAIKAGENDNVGSYVMTIFGYSPHYLTSIPQLSGMEKISYKAKKKLVFDLVEDLRKHRNDAVHSGFRRWDVDSKTMKCFEVVSGLAVLRIVAVLEGVIRNDIKEISDLQSNFFLHCRNHIDIEHAQNVLLHSLKEHISI